MGLDAVVLAGGAINSPQLLLLSGVGPAEDLRAKGVAVVLDISARKRAEAFAARPQGDFEQVFDRAPIGTGLFDTDGRWLLVNRALCEITGYTADELIGKRFDGIMHPEDANNDARDRERLLAGEIAALQVEKRYFDAAGEVVSAIVSMSLVRDRDGAPLHYIAQLQDISERKRLDAELLLASALGVVAAHGIHEPSNSHPSRRYALASPAATRFSPNATK